MEETAGEGRSLGPPQRDGHAPPLLGTASTRLGRHHGRAPKISTLIGTEKGEIEQTCLVLACGCVILAPTASERLCVCLLPFCFVSLSLSNVIPCCHSLCTTHVVLCSFCVLRTLDALQRCCDVFRRTCMPPLLLANHPIQDNGVRAYCFFANIC